MPTEVTGSIFVSQPVPQNVPYSSPLGISTVATQIVIHNAGDSPVACGYVRFQFYAGGSPVDLVASYADLQQVNATATSQWTVGPPQVGTFTATPPGGTAVIYGNQRIGFTFSGIPVNDAPGNAKIAVTVGTSSPQVTPVYITKTPAGLAITSFYANAVQINPGDTVTLSWSTTGANQVALYPPGQIVSPYGHHNVTLNEGATCTLKASGSAKPWNLEQQLYISVIAPKILSVTCSPPEGAPVLPGQECTVSWSTYNAARAYLLPYPGGTLGQPFQVEPAAGGSIKVHPLQSTRYGMYVRSATTPPGTDTSNGVLITVIPPVIHFFRIIPGYMGTRASPLIFYEGTVIQWSTSHATGVYLNGSPVSPAGSRSIYLDYGALPARNPIYTLTAAGGVSPPSSPLTVYIGGVQILGVSYLPTTNGYWQVDVATINALTCTMNGSPAIALGGMWQQSFPYGTPMPPSVYCTGPNGTTASQAPLPPRRN